LEKSIRAKHRLTLSQSIPVKSLTPLVSEVENWEVYRDVLTSMESEGLLEPLSVLIMGCNKEEWLRVDKGCNRLRAAQELGYTHIDCNLYEEWDELFKASEIGRKRSKAWRVNI